MIKTKETSQIIEKIREMQVTHKDLIFDLYMSVADIQSLVMSIKIGCRGLLPDVIAEVDHMWEVVEKMNQACIAAGEPPICPEFQNATTPQIITSIMLHSRGIKLKDDLKWLDEIEELHE